MEGQKQVSHKDTEGGPKQLTTDGRGLTQMGENNFKL